MLASFFAGYPMKDAKTNSILTRMLLATKAPTDSALAKEIGVSPQSVSDARRKDKVPTSWAITVAEKYQVKLDWIWFGIGSQYLTQTNADTSEFTGAEHLTPPPIHRDVEQNCELKKQIAVLEARLEEKQNMIDKLLELNKGGCGPIDAAKSAPHAPMTDQSNDNNLKI